MSRLSFDDENESKKVVRNRQELTENKKSKGIKRQARGREQDEGRKCEWSKVRRAEDEVQRGGVERGKMHRGLQRLHNRERKKTTGLRVVEEAQWSLVWRSRVRSWEGTRRVEKESVRARALKGSSERRGREEGILQDFCARAKEGKGSKRTHHLILRLDPPELGFLLLDFLVLVR